MPSRMPPKNAPAPKPQVGDGVDADVVVSFCDIVVVVTVSVVVAADAVVVVESVVGVWPLTQMAISKILKQTAMTNRRNVTDKNIFSMEKIGILSY